jgi:hypothetical protein
MRGKRVVDRKHGRGIRCELRDAVSVPCSGKYAVFIPARKLPVERIEKVEC